MSAYVRKTKDIYIIETNLGYGWEEECRYDNLDAARADLKEYKIYAQSYGGAARLVRRRERI